VNAEAADLPVFHGDGHFRSYRPAERRDCEGVGDEPVVQLDVGIEASPKRLAPFNSILTSFCHSSSTILLARLLAETKKKDELRGFHPLVHLLDDSISRLNRPRVIKDLLLTENLAKSDRDGLNHRLVFVVMAQKNHH
jgi:hypothetical protein